MAAITVHAGDYACGQAWFYPPRTVALRVGGGFVVRTHNNRPHNIPVENIAAAKLATAATIRQLGGNEAMIDALERLSEGERAGAFVALFTDGSMMLASTDVETCWRICTGRSSNR
jgi:hypothetical protein